MVWAIAEGRQAAAQVDKFLMKDEDFVPVGEEVIPSELVTILNGNGNGRPKGQRYPEGLDQAKQDAVDACVAVHGDDDGDMLKRCIDLSVEAAALGDNTIVSEQSY